MSYKWYILKSGIVLFVLLSLMLASCTKSDNYGDVTIAVDYLINDNTLITDSLCYSNEFGNEFLITEIQWFISRIEVQDENGDWIHLEQNEKEIAVSHTSDGVFYLDTSIPDSHVIELAPIPTGKYKTFRFVFGLNEEDNHSGLFSNPPEADMFWPDVLGGGYHYMKLNGKYLNSDGRLAPLATHLGIGPNEELTEFYQNYFIVEIPIDFSVDANANNHICLTMIVDNWFRNPNMIDFNEYGSSIMQNQTAQQLIRCNGIDVFSIVQCNEKESAMKEKKTESIAELINSVIQKAAPKLHFWSWKSVVERHESIKPNDSKY